MNLTPSEHNELRELLGSPVHLLEEDAAKRRSHLLGQADYDDMVASSGPHPKTQKVSGWIYCFDGVWALVGPEDYYIHEEHYIQCPDPDNHSREGGYRIPEHLQPWATKHQGKRVDAVIQNWLLGEPSGPILELSYAEPDTSHIDPANEVARKATEAAYREMPKHISGCETCQARYENLEKPQRPRRPFIGLCVEGERLLAAYTKLWQAWTKNRSDCNACFDACSVASGHFAACDTCDNRCSYHCSNPAQNHGRKTAPPTQQDCTCHWCNS